MNEAEAKISDAPEAPEAPGSSPARAGHPPGCSCCSAAAAAREASGTSGAVPGDGPPVSLPASDAEMDGEQAPAVSVRKLGVSIGRYDILKGVTLTVPPRRQTVVIGPNGAGKSTLVKAVLGQIDHSGTIAFSPAKPRFGYVPQRLDYDRHLPITVAEFMSLGRSRWPVWLGTPGRVRQESLAKLELVRAGHLYARPLGSLSGGESQRVFLARALMDDPDILVLDEPATGVDVMGEQLLCEILEGFKSDFTVLMVSHDLAAARAHGDWIVCLNRTVVAEGPPSEIFRPEIISLAFGIHQSLLFSGGTGFPSIVPAEDPLTAPPVTGQSLTKGTAGADSAPPDVPEAGKPGAAGAVPGGSGAETVPVSGGSGTEVAPSPGGSGAGSAPVSAGPGAGTAPSPGGSGTGSAPVSGGPGAGTAPSPGGSGTGSAPLSGGSGAGSAPAKADEPGRASGGVSL